MIHPAGIERSSQINSSVDKLINAESIGVKIRLLTGVIYERGKPQAISKGKLISVTTNCAKQNYNNQCITLSFFNAMPIVYCRYDIMSR